MKKWLNYAKIQSSDVLKSDFDKELDIPSSIEYRQTQWAAISQEFWLRCEQSVVVQLSRWLRFPCHVTFLQCRLNVAWNRFLAEKSFLGESRTSASENELAKSRFVDKMTFRFVQVDKLELNGNRSIFRCQVGKAASFAAVGSNPNSGDRFVQVKSPLKYTWMIILLWN